MESIWWVFKQLFEKGLVYRGFKVMPFSTACSTPLSNFESGQNYKEVVDPAGKLPTSYAAIIGYHNVALF